MPCPYRTDSPRSLTRVFPWNFTVLNFDSNQQSISKALPRCLYKDFQWVTFVEVRFNLNLIAALWWHRNFHLHQGRHNILERATVPQSHTAFWCFCPPRGRWKAVFPPFLFVWFCCFMEIFPYLSADCDLSILWRCPNLLLILFPASPYPCFSILTEVSVQLLPTFAGHASSTACTK